MTEIEGEWPYRKMENNIPIMISELGYRSPEQTQVTIAVVFLKNGSHETFYPKEGKFVTFCWLEWCKKNHKMTLSDLLENGPEFFGAIWHDTSHKGFINFLKVATRVEIILDGKTFIFR